MKATLELSTGQKFTGRLIGAPLQSSGELVFTTGMVGYSEALSDPSYFGQILVFSYPLIGNYGIPTDPTQAPDLPLPKGFESRTVHASAVIVETHSPQSFHWTSHQTLDEWLRAKGVPGISGLDTRHLVHLIRSEPCLLAKVSPETPEGERILDGGFRPMSHDSSSFFDPGKYEILGSVSSPKSFRIGKGKKRIALLDLGVKWNILRKLIERGCEIEVLPWNTPFEKVDCSGWVLSNGPGDPLRTGDLVSRVRNLITTPSQPILGICLGHQILALAAGFQTQRMKYGHRSHNQPVYEVVSRRGYITSQNHGYVVLEENRPVGWEPWFLNANDQTLEGIRHQTKPFRSVQFHPEATGGPQDTAWILDQFVEEVKKGGSTS